MSWLCLPVVSFLPFLQIKAELNMENQRLKDENGALIRVITKLSKWDRSSRRRGADNRSHIYTCILLTFSPSSDRMYVHIKVESFVCWVTIRHMYDQLWSLMLLYCILSSSTFPDRKYINLKCILYIHKIFLHKGKCPQDCQLLVFFLHCVEISKAFLTVC